MQLTLTELRKTEKTAAFWETLFAPAPVKKECSLLVSASSAIKRNEPNGELVNRKGKSDNFAVYERLEFIHARVYWQHCRHKVDQERQLQRHRCAAGRLQARRWRETAHCKCTNEGHCLACKLQ